MFVINGDVKRTEAGVKWMDDSISGRLGLVDLLAKWCYEAKNNYDNLPIPLGSELMVTPSIPPVDNLTDFGFDVWVSINEFYDDAVKMWDGYNSTVSGQPFAPYYRQCSQYVQDFFDDLGVFKATHGLCTYWNNNSAALGWYKNVVYQCKSPADFRRFMIELDKLLKKRYPENDIRVRIPEAKTGGCYIATSVYGSYDCPEVWTLRRYRDNKLLQSAFGRLFVKVYYATSPTAVKLFGKTEWFNRFWRNKLDRMIAKLKAEGYDDTPYCDR